MIVDFFLYYLQIFSSIWAAAEFIHLVFWLESLIVTFGWVVWSMKENYLDLNCRTHERFMDWFTLKKKKSTYYQHKSMCSTEEGMSLPEINSPGYFQARGKRHLNSLKSKSSPEHVSSFHCSEASMSKSAFWKLQFRRLTTLHHWRLEVSTGKISEDVYKQRHFHIIQDSGMTAPDINSIV